MKIRGKFQKDTNFITVYANNTMYTISRNTGEWGYIKVGDIAFNGCLFTQEIYDSMKESCENSGTFILR